MWIQTVERDWVQSNTIIRAYIAEKLFCVLTNEIEGGENKVHILCKSVNPERVPNLLHSFSESSSYLILSTEDIHRRLS